jgi:hypothetical protein
MSKYQKLAHYLQNLEGESFTTNFGAIEDILGFELPASARQYPAWWANQDKGQSTAWQSVGWKTADVSLGIGTITFVRENSETAQIWNQIGEHLTIEQAKRGLAAALGITPECIEITIRA